MEIRRLGIILFIIFFALSFSLNGQDKHLSIDMSKKTFVYKNIDLGENGFILHLGPLFRSNENHSLRYYSSELELLWDKKIDLKYNALVKLPGGMAVIASETGSYVYAVSYRDNFKNGILITQINKSGETVSKELIPGEGAGKSVQAVYCDDNNLYVLTTLNRWELADNKKVEEQLVLNVIDHQTLNIKSKVLRLPLLKDRENTTYWEYHGNDEKLHYLISRFADPELNNVEARIIGFDSQTNIVRDVIIKPDLNGHYVKKNNPVVPQTRNWYSGVDFNFRETTSKLPNASSQPVFVTLPGSFNHWFFDEKGKHFYNYGLTADKKFTRKPDEFGFYIAKYTNEGQIVWQNYYRDIPELDNDKLSKIHYKGFEALTSFKVLGSGTINFSIYHLRKRYNMEISSQGNFIKTYFEDKTREVVDGICRDSGQNFKSGKLIQTYSTNNRNTYSNTCSGKGELFFNYDEIKLTYDMYYFKPVKP